MSNSLWPHWLQCTRLLCPSLSPGVCSDPCPLSQWCYLTISSSAHFSFAFNLSQQQVCLFVCFPVSWLFTSGGQRIGAPTSASVLPMNIWDWFPLGLTGLTSLKYKGLKSLLQHHSLKASVFRDSVFFVVQLTSVAGKTIALDYADICWCSEPSAFQYAV